MIVVYVVVVKMMVILIAMGILVRSLVLRVMMNVGSVEVMGFNRIVDAELLASLEYQRVSAIVMKIY